MKYSILILILGLTLSSLSNAHMHAYEDPSPHYDSFKENLTEFKDRLFQKGIGKISKEDWDYLKQAGKDLAKSGQHDHKYNYDEHYRTCHNFTTIIPDRAHSNPDQIIQIAWKSNTNTHHLALDVKQVATVTFEIYVEDYNEAEYEEVFYNFFMHAHEFEGLCIDDMFARNIHDFIISYNKLVQEILRLNAAKAP